MDQVLVITAIVLASLALIFAIIALVLILSKMYSTHQIQYVPTPNSALKEMFEPEGVTIDGDDSSVTIEQRAELEKMMQTLFNPSKEEFNDSLF